MTIQVLLSDDWELRGDGSGNMRAIQFATVRELMDVYERHGVRGTFNVEVMQQLAHLRFGREHPELARLADEWEEVVREMYSRGHDVQLHVHVQWDTATYQDGAWRLADNWSIIEYPENVARRVLTSCQQYLQGLLRPLDPAYRCVAFRSGSWAIAPSRFMLKLLADMGIVFDMSLGDGIHYDLPMVRLDYRGLDEPFLPFYPDPADARRRASTPQPVVCVATHTFRVPGLRQEWLRLQARLLQRLAPSRYRSRFAAPCDTPVRDRGCETTNRRWVLVKEPAGELSRFKKLWQRVIRARARLSEPQHIISDLSGLSYTYMRDMMADIDRRARACSWANVPVIIENHTKDIGDFQAIDRLLSDLGRRSDVEFITARCLASNLQSGHYPLGATPHARAA